MLELAATFKIESSNRSTLAAFDNSTITGTSADFSGTVEANQVDVDGTIVFSNTYGDVGSDQSYSETSSKRSLIITIPDSMNYLYVND